MQIVFPHRTSASYYALTLQLGFSYLRAASKFWDSDMTPEQLKEILDIGKMGRDGLHI